MSLRIITGSTGTNHVTSQDDGSLNQVILGSKSVVLDIGEKLSATIVDNNTVRISDGDLLLQGRHARVDAGTVEDVTIGTGTIEMNRNDLIVARYTLDTATGYEDISFVVIEGTETSGTASDPAYNTGDIRTGSAIVDFPLYRVKIEGINIIGLVRLFEITGGASSSLIGEAYSAIKNYSFGEVCIDNGVMWTSKISNNIGNAPQEGTYWTKSSIAKQLGGLQFGIDGDGNGGYYKADGSFSPFKNGEEPILLWTNTAPTSQGFNAQTINLDLSKYNAVLIETARDGDRSENRLHTSYIELDKEGMIFSSIGQSTSATSSVVSRPATVNQNGITFGSATGNNATLAIPLRIWGVPTEFQLVQRSNMYAQTINKSKYIERTIPTDTIVTAGCDNASLIVTKNGVSQPVIIDTLAYSVFDAKEGDVIKMQTTTNTEYPAFISY